MHSSEPSEPVPQHRGQEPTERCPDCDSVIPAGAEVCLMCGMEIGYRPAEERSRRSEIPEKHSQAAEADTVSSSHVAQTVVISIMRERQSQITFWFTAVFALFIVVLGVLVLRYQSPVVEVALVPSGTPLPPTIALTSTAVGEAVATIPLGASPTVAATPLPTETPRPPRSHTVNAGETLIGLALRYRVSVESISSLNGFDPDSPIQVQQNLEIPWPTPTPPLVAVAVTVRGVNVVADPTNCEWYEVEGGDSISSIAAKHDVDFELLMLVNRMSTETILFQGDALCIPEIKIGGFLPPTPGPSPTPSPTPPPAGPNLLYPVRNAVVRSTEPVVTLLWTAVKDLQESEWYMVELSDLDQLDGLPLREFTRDTSLQLPDSWRPPPQTTHQMRWRVSIVNVTGQRSDGKFIYEYGGQVSEESRFSWSGAIQVSPTASSLSATATP